MVRRMKNHRTSLIHRLPPELLALVASHLKNDKSLVMATHVCHLWRSVLLDFPYLWSHLSFKNEPRALVFLERSKEAPVAVDLDLDSAPSENVEITLKRITKKMTALRAVHLPFLDKLLTQPLPVLGYLDVVTSGDWPSVRSLATTNLGHLTVFLFMQSNPSGSAYLPRIRDGLLDFLRNCPLLEILFFHYDEPETDTEFKANEESTEVVSLPYLQSFIHESPRVTVHVDLFNRLSLPPACNVAFTVTGPQPSGGPWNCDFATLSGRFRLFGAKMVKIAFQAQGGDVTMFRTMFLNSKQTVISFNRLVTGISYSTSGLQVKDIVDFVGGSKMADSVDELCFEDCPVLPPNVDSLRNLSCLKTIVIWQCDPNYFLGAAWPSGVEELVICPLPYDPHCLEVWGILKGVLALAVSRQEHGNPLKSFTLHFRDSERLSRVCERELTELMGCVGTVQVL